MKKVSKALFAMALTTTLVVPTVAVGAETTDMKEVEGILNERTANPKVWLDFIESMKDDKAVGQWLPELILKLANDKGVEAGVEKEVVKVTYKTVIEGFDHGPGLSKVVLKPSVAINPANLNKDTFNVSTVTTYKDLDFATFKIADEATEHEVSRIVEDAYLSDAEGNRDSKGEYIALELYVHPDLSETSPFYYNFITGKNEYKPFYHNITLNENANLLTNSGKAVELVPAGKSESLGDYKLIAEDFVNNQKYKQGDIELTYASFVPETASEKTGSNPLIIWLHGAGEGGTDTTINILGNKVVNLATEEIQQYFGETGAYILAPQTPTMWMNDGTGAYTKTGESVYTEALMGLIDSYVKANPEIDTNRIYIGGCSNGGYMTVNMIIEYPEYFAAAYPVCEAYGVDWLTEEKIEAIKDMPIWLTHALSDMTVAIAEGEPEIFNLRPFVDEKGNPKLVDNFSNALYDRLVAAGNKNVYYSLYDTVVDTSGQFYKQDGVTPYEYMGHWSWIYTLNNDSTEVIDGVETTIFEWLSQQSK